MNIPVWVEDLFASIDGQDSEKFCSYFTDEGTFVFSNMEPVKGVDNIREAVGGFFSSIKGLKHDLHNCWERNGSVITNGIVTYTRHDGSELTVPFADIFYMSGNKVKDYLIYIDISKLYQ